MDQTSSLRLRAPPSDRLRGFRAPPRIIARGPPPD